jgi:dTDP-4-dehydrorhamnose 3,5-epimerase
MKVMPVPLDGALLLWPQVHRDCRGFFVETFQQQRYQQIGITNSFVQDNWSRSVRGVLRGLHFQRTKPQGKLIRVVHGEIFDVAVDMRPQSATFGHWYGVVLSESNQCQFWLPPGMAHGFLVLSEVADVEYKCTRYFDVDDEDALCWNDPDLAIDWPLGQLPEKYPVVSERDRSAKRWRELLATLPDELNGRSA